MKITNHSFNSKVIEPSANSLGLRLKQNIQKGGYYVSNPGILF